MKHVVTRFATNYLVLSIAILVCGSSILGAQKKKTANADPKWKVTKPDLTKELMEADNSYCIVCHIDLEDEELVDIHQPFGVGCETCHGMSMKHSADEDNLTPPEIMWSKHRINARCMTCHFRKDMLKKEEAAKEHKQVFARMEDPNCKTNKQKHCTECHGEHRIKNRTRVWDRETGKVVKQTGGPNMDR